jgi:hypothetical protein
MSPGILSGLTDLFLPINDNRFLIRLVITVNVYMQLLQHAFLFSLMAESHPSLAYVTQNVAYNLWHSEQPMTVYVSLVSV